MPARMAAVDAQFYWMSAMIPSDQFLLYAFADEPADFDRAVDKVRARAQACPHLTMRVDDGSILTSGCRRQSNPHTSSHTSLPTTPGAAAWTPWCGSPATS